MILCTQVIKTKSIPKPPNNKNKKVTVFRVSMEKSVIPTINGIRPIPTEINPIIPYNLEVYKLLHLSVSQLDSSMKLFLKSKLLALLML